ncbi:MAG: DUF262 domain-containing protein [Candidatus Thorarchaeota archaeon]
MDNKESLFKKEEYFVNKLVCPIQRFILHDKEGELRFPDFQRDYVWTEEDKIKLIESIFENIEIGRIVLHEEFNRNKSPDTWCYEVIDGKQRLGAILDYTKDKFKVKGKLFSELNILDQRAFSFVTIPVSEVKNLQRKYQLDLFVKVNTTGVRMSEEHLNKVKKELKELNEGVKDDGGF